MEIFFVEVTAGLIGLALAGLIGDKLIKIEEEEDNEVGKRKG